MKIGSHNSVMFFSWDMVEGMGPSMDVPCMSLKQIDYTII